MKNTKKLGIMIKIVDVISILLIIIGLFFAAGKAPQPSLTFTQYQELSAAVNEAELAAAEGMGGRHALVVMLLNQWGYIVTGTSWQIIRFAQRLLDKGWKPGTEPKPEDW